MQKNYFTIIGVLFAAVVLAALFFMQDDSSPNYNPTTNATSTRQVPPGWNEYTNIVYHFSLFYPQDLTAREYKEPGTAMTVTFGSLLGGREFQVFVVPYGEKQITPERFKLDVPSGVMASSTNILLDGVAATSFYTVNGTMADTYEIWFIYHGFLYEVTTYKEFAPWLDDIMRGWKFL